MNLNSYQCRTSFSYKIDSVVVVSDVKFSLEKFIKAYQDLCDCLDLLNSSFTFQLAPLLVNIIITKTFTGYGVLWELITPTPHRGLVFLQNASWLMVMHLLEIMIAFIGSAVTKAAQETVVIMTKILNHSKLDEDFALPMQHFVSRVNCRNLKVQNCFFKINWMILLHVRCFFASVKTKLNVFSSSQRQPLSLIWSSRASLKSQVVAPWITQLNESIDIWWNKWLQTKVVRIKNIC